LEEAKAFASRDESELRAAIWHDWETLTTAVREATTAIAAVWLSGSYFSTTERPGDIDCLYVVDRALLERAGGDTATAEFLALVSKAKEAFGLKVDGFILPWWPRPGTHRGSEERRSGYLESRGYWDDLWSRTRGTDLKEAARPRQGYLEVILDGYR